MDGAGPPRRAVLLSPAPLVLAALGASVTGACTTPRPPRAARSLRADLVLGAGSPGGVYVAWFGAVRDELAETFPRLSVEVLPSSGSLENLRRLHRGEVTLCLATADSVVEAGAGSSAALARIYDDYVHLLVPATSPVQQLADLRGRRVALGAAGSGTSLIAGRVLAAGGVDDVRPLDLGLDDALTALREGAAGAAFWSGGLPTPAVTRTAELLPLRLVPLDGVAGTMRERYGGAYREAAVPAGTYQGVRGVRTLVIANLVTALPDLDREVVLAVLETLFDRREAIARRVPAARALSPRTAIATQPVALHPAALEYYRAIKP